MAKHPTIVGDPEMLARLRAWAEPRIGPISTGGGPGSIELLQELIEELAAASGAMPQYRKPSDG